MELLHCEPEDLCLDDLLAAQCLSFDSQYMQYCGEGMPAAYDNSSFTIGRTKKEISGYLQYISPIHSGFESTFYTQVRKDMLRRESVLIGDRTAQSIGQEYTLEYETPMAFAVHGTPFYYDVLRSAYVSEVAVLPAERGTGLATTLLMETTGRLRHQGIEHMFGATMSDNRSMKGVFSRCGFKKVLSIDGMMDGTKEHELYVKRL